MVLDKVAKHVQFSPVKPYAFRRGAHINCFMANEDGIVNFSARTLKTIGNHALNYHEKYVSVNLLNLANKFAKMKKIRVEEFTESLCPRDHGALIEAMGTINLMKAASDIVSTFPQFQVKLYTPFQAILFSGCRGYEY